MANSFLLHFNFGVGELAPWASTASCRTPKNYGVDVAVDFGSRFEDLEKGGMDIGVNVGVIVGVGVGFKGVQPL